MGPRIIFIQNHSPEVIPRLPRRFLKPKKTIQFVSYNPLGVYFSIYLDRKIDLFDHLIQNFEVVIPIIESEIEFPIQ